MEPFEGTSYSFVLRISWVASELCFGFIAICTDQFCSIWLNLRREHSPVHFRIHPATSINTSSFNSSDLVPVAVRHANSPLPCSRDNLVSFETRVVKFPCEYFPLFIKKRKVSSFHPFPRNCAGSFRSNSSQIQMSCSVCNQWFAPFCKWTDSFI